MPFKKDLLALAVSLAVLPAASSFASISNQQLMSMMAQSDVAAHYFERVALLPVYKNLDAAQSMDEETVAEIVTATADGMALLYTDSAQGRLGKIDISNPSQPKPAGFLDVGGEATSVAVKGNYAFVAVDTSEDYVNPSGKLVVVNAAKMTKIGEFDMGGQPDSVAVSPDGKYIAVAIESQRDEAACPDGMGGLIADAYDNEEACEAAGHELGALPQYPAGFVVTLDISASSPAAWTLRQVDLTGLADVNGDDPEPEYVSINSKNQLVVSLQENNHLAIIDLATGAVTNHFSAGTASFDGVDVEKNKLLETNGTIEDMPREPDAVSWVNDELFATANEGDWNGGSRGFSLFDKAGNLVHDAGNTVEQLALKSGHYPEKRAGKKGTEPEGVVTGHFEAGDFLFVGSERGNFVAVYKMEGNTPSYQQLLPVGIGPEGLAVIPSRNLFVVASEKDDAENGTRSNISLFELKAKAPVFVPAEFPEITWDYIQSLGGFDKLIAKLIEISKTLVEIKVNPEYPHIVAEPTIGWGAMSSLAADAYDENILYATHDSFYVDSRIYTLDVSAHPAVITNELVLNKDGETVSYDLEGLAVNPAGGFWGASEGKPGSSDNLLVKISATGEVEQEVMLPESISAEMTKFGFEGVAVDGGKVYVVVQREWNDDPDGLVKVGAYDPAANSWSFYYYPLDAAPEGAWVGLSELTALGNGKFAVIERDNQQGEKAKIKRIYEFDIGKAVSSSELAYPLLAKTLKQDVLPMMQAGHGWVADKLEGMAVAKDGRVYLVTDNDGLDDAMGETQLIRIESLED